MFKTALRFVVFDKAKSIGALAGIIISVFLIGQQIGIFIFLTDAMAYITKANREYIWVVDERTTNVNALANLDTRIGYQLESIPGVQSVDPLVIANGAAKFANGKSGALTLVGVEAPGYVGGPWNVVSGTATDLLKDGAVFTDVFDASVLGNTQLGDYFEVNGKQVFIAGQTSGVRGFGGGAVSFTTIERARSLTGLPSTAVSAYLLRCDTTLLSETELVNRINATIPGVRAWTGAAFTSATVNEVLASSGIAFSVGSLIVFAFISGLIIIGLTLYSAAMDRIRDYGTLKAMGATGGYIRRLILTQATVFSMIGFSLGYLLIEGFRKGIAQAGTIFEFGPVLITGFFLLTLVLSFGGSLFAIIRINRVEPAMVFRG